MTKAELDNFKPGRGIPHCAVLARPQCEPVQELLCGVSLMGTKKPRDRLSLHYMPSIIDQRKGIIANGYCESLNVR